MEAVSSGQILLDAGRGEVSSGKEALASDESRLRQFEVVISDREAEVKALEEELAVQMATVEEAASKQGRKHREAMGEVEDLARDVKGRSEEVAAR